MVKVSEPTLWALGNLLLTSNANVVPMKGSMSQLFQRVVYPGNLVLSVRPALRLAKRERATASVSLT